MDVTFVENQAFFGDTYLQGESQLGEDKWWESNQPLSMPNVVYSSMPRPTSDSIWNIAPDLNSRKSTNFGIGLGFNSGVSTVTVTQFGIVSGSNFGMSTNSGPDESLSHDSHS